MNTHQYKAFLDLSTSPVALLSSPDMLVCDANQAFTRLLSRPRIKLLDQKLQTLLDWVVPHDSKSVTQFVGSGKRSIKLDVYVGSKSNRLTKLTLKLQKTTLEGRKFVLGSFPDWKQQQKDSNLMKFNGVNYMTMVNTYESPIIIHSGTFLLFANKAMCQITGCTLDELPSRRFHDAITHYILSSQGKNIRQMFRDSMNPDQLVEALIKERSGNHKHFLLRSFPIIYLDKKATVTVFNDITLLRENEKFIQRNLSEKEELELKTISMQLHDDIGTSLSMLKLRLSKLADAGSGQNLAEPIGNLEKLIDELILKNHDISHKILPHLIEDFGIEAAVSDLQNRLRRQSGARITFHSNLDGIRLSPVTELSVYRIIEELMTCSTDNRKASRISLRLILEEDKLGISYYDNAKNFDNPEPMQPSIINCISNQMNRLRMINGEAKILSNRCIITVNLSNPL